MRLEDIHTKSDLWNYFEEMLPDEKVSFSDLFNYFSTSELKGLAEHLKDEGY